VTPAQADEPERIAAVVEPPPSPAPAAVAPSNVVVERAEGAMPETHGDTFIHKAQEAALDFTETLPNYVCQEMIARFYSETSPVSWHAIDVVSTEVVYDHGKEDYRNITINGKAVKKGWRSSPGRGPPASSAPCWWTSSRPPPPPTSASGGSRAPPEWTRACTIFTVERENSHWSIHSGAQTYLPAYSGSVWVDPKTSRVLRIEMQARNFPSEFPLDKVESATDYEYVRLGTMQQYLLPVHAETLSCQRGTSRCSRNAIDFRNYHKYAGESTIQFGESQNEKKSEPKKK